MSNQTERAVAMVSAGLITERRSCLSKVSYRLRNDALGAAKRIANKTSRATSVYACSFCKGFHVYKLSHGEDE